MKKNIKSWGRFSISVFLLGLALSIAAVSMGALNATVTTYDGEKFDQTYASEITNLSIDIEAGRLDILKGESFRVVAENVSSESFYCDVQDGALTVKNYALNGVKTQDRKGWINFLKLFDMDDKGLIPTITLFVPSDFFFEEADVNVTVGKCLIDWLSTKKMNVIVSAGDVWVSEMHAETAVFDIAAGKCEINSLMSENLEVNVGAGYIRAVNLQGVEKYDVSVNTGSAVMSLLEKPKYDANFSVNLGALSLYLPGRENDYDLSLKVGLGNMQVNDKKYTSDAGTPPPIEYAESTPSIEIADSTTPLESAVSEFVERPKIRLNCDLGSIDVIFEG